MKKIMIIAIIFAFAIFSLVYSGVLNYYGKIVGNVNVQGPIFYADFSQNKLLINTKPSTDHSVSFSDSDSKFIFTEDLGGINFNYQIKCIFKVRAKSTQDNQVLRLYCRYYDITWHDLCYQDISVSTTEQTYTASCTTSLTSINNVRRFGYKFEGQSPDNTVQYIIYSNVDGDTYLQITKP